MKQEQFKQITEETYHFLNNNGVNFICYIWDKEEKCGGGCQSASADIGDALVVIERLVKRFDIDIDRLVVALADIKAEQGKN